MTTAPFVRFLASVTSEAEASLAVAGGADIIDCKDPTSGALGALPADAVAAVRRAVPAHIPISATIGDLPLDSGAVVAAHLMAGTGIDIVKVGLFTVGDTKGTIRRLGREIATPLVAVMIADAPFEFGLVDDLADAGFAGVMLDTATKDGRTLLDHCSPATLRSFISAAHGAGLSAGLAGSLRAGQIPELLTLAPDILGFRGALCRASDRKSELDASALAAVRKAMPRPSSAAPLWGRAGAGQRARADRALEALP